MNDKKRIHSHIDQKNNYSSVSNTDECHIYVLKEQYEKLDI